MEFAHVKGEEMPIKQDAVSGIIANHQNILRITTISIKSFLQQHMSSIDAIFLSLDWILFQL